MATPLTLPYITLDVFTETRFAGNPLAIVRLPAGSSITQAQKQTIAREFNFSETVFLHEADENNVSTVDIFMTTSELPFAGHPTVGTAWYLRNHLNIASPTLKIKAGIMPVKVMNNGVAVSVPVDFRDHGAFVIPSLKSNQWQPQLKDSDFVNGIDGPEPVVSIVKGMTFVLVEMTSEDALSRLQTFGGKVAIPKSAINEWSTGFAGMYAFFVREDGLVCTRMIEGTLEDPATGSAASTLGGWLTQRQYPGVSGNKQLNIVQGVKMGRESHIGVEVTLGAKGSVEEILLSGTAVLVMEGAITV